MSRCGRAIDLLDDWRDGQTREHTHEYGDMTCERCTSEMKAWDIIASLDNINPMFRLDKSEFEKILEIVEKVAAIDCDGGLGAGDIGYESWCTVCGARAKSDDDFPETPHEPTCVVKLARETIAELEKTDG